MCVILTAVVLYISEFNPFNIFASVPAFVVRLTLTAALVCHGHHTSRLCHSSIEFGLCYCNYIVYYTLTIA